jgi:hypothetical protein
MIFICNWSYFALNDVRVYRLACVVEIIYGSEVFETERSVCNLTAHFRLCVGL